MSEIKNLCVFCSSSSNVGDRYKDIAKQTGHLFAEQGFTVVYGGGSLGLMGITADAALEKGGEVIGVIPRHLEGKEIAHSRLTELHVTETMHERQLLMSKLSDGFVVLPGGLGTLAEFFEVLTWRQLSLQVKPIILVNAYGYWDLLLEMMDQIVEQNFLHEELNNLLHIVNNVPDVVDLLREIEKQT